MPLQSAVDDGPCCDSVVVVDAVAEYIAKLPQSGVSDRGDSCYCTAPHSPSAGRLHSCAEPQTWTSRTPQGFGALGASCVEAVHGQGIPGHLHYAFAPEIAQG